MIVTHQNLKDIEKMLSETFERVIQGSRYSHLSATRKKVVSTFVTQKTSEFLQQLVINSRQPTEEEIPLESVDSKLTRQIEELTEQLNNVEQQLIVERELKIQEYEATLVENLKKRYNVDDPVEDLPTDLNDTEVTSEQISAENIMRLYETLTREWQKAREFSSLEDKLAKISMVLQNMSQTEMNSLRPVLESVSNLLRKVNSQENSHIEREFARGTTNGTLEGKLLAMLCSPEASSALSDAP